MPFMGTDLGKLMKLERLSEDRVQFLVYQMLKGLKVNTTTNTYACYQHADSIFQRISVDDVLLLMLSYLLSPQYIHSAGIIHRVREL